MLLDENRNCNCGMNNTNSLAPSADENAIQGNP